jgi:hypothetical protein
MQQANIIHRPPEGWGNRKKPSVLLRAFGVVKGIALAVIVGLLLFVAMPLAGLFLGFTSAFTCFIDYCKSRRG